MIGIEYPLDPYEFLACTLNEYVVPAYKDITTKELFIDVAST